MTSLYSCREIPGSGFAITKFDSDLNPITTYEVTNATCTCPAGVRPTCKHRSRLLPAFMLRKHISDGWFLNDQNMMWHRPVDAVPGYTQLDQIEPPQGASGEGPGQSPLAAPVGPSPSASGRSQPDLIGFKRRV